MGNVGNYPFVQCRNYTPVVARGIDLVVLHDMEAPDKPETAENVAAWFAGPTAPPASAHLCADSTGIVRCCHDHDVAWHAPGANHNGIGIEMSGYAADSGASWLDPSSSAMLDFVARATADYCLVHGLPATFRTAADLLAGGSRARGVTTHWEVSKAYRRSDHFDPGRQFPIANFMNRVVRAISGAQPPEVVAVRIPNLVGKTTTPNGGLYMCGSDGGVFTFKGAPYLGGMAGKPMNGPVVDVVAYSDGGYWLIGADGGIFAFGDAPGVAPYTPFFNEYRLGVHAMRFGFYSPGELALLADDLAMYRFPVPA